MTDRFADLSDLYQDVIMDRGRKPRHGKRLETFDATAKGDNPMCGDRVQVWLRHDGRNIAAVGFEARGCAISVASADLMVDAVTGRDKADIKALFAAFLGLAKTGACPACDAGLTASMTHLLPLGGVHEYPSRVKCATLPWHALIAALDGTKETSSE
jgi:nitrogen fixation NifU-like protein